MATRQSFLGLTADDISKIDQAINTSKITGVKAIRTLTGLSLLDSVEFINVYKETRDIVETEKIFYAKGRVCLKLGKPLLNGLQSLDPAERHLALLSIQVLRDLLQTVPENGKKVIKGVLVRKPESNLGYEDFGNEKEYLFLFQHATAVSIKRFGIREARRTKKALKEMFGALPFKGVSVRIQRMFRLLKPYTIVFRVELQDKRTGIQAYIDSLSSV